MSSEYSHLPYMFSSPPHTSVLLSQGPVKYYTSHLIEFREFNIQSLHSVYVSHQISLTIILCHKGRSRVILKSLNVS